MLKIATEGRKAALDLRLVMSRVRDSPDSKVNLAVAQIHQRFIETNPDSRERSLQPARARQTRRMAPFPLPPAERPHGDGGAPARPTAGESPMAAPVLKIPVQELFPRRESGGRLSKFMEKIETTRF